MDTPWEQIPSQRCRELLATASVGRLAVSVRALPVILPVRYYVTGHNRLAVCLGHHSIPVRSLNETIIAFTADTIDPAARSGWSVQIQGRSSVPRLGGFDTACGQPAAGQTVEIEPGTITGHYLHLCPSSMPSQQGAKPPPETRPASRLTTGIGTLRVTAGRSRRVGP